MKKVLLFASILGYFMYLFPVFDCIEIKENNTGYYISNRGNNFLNIYPINRTFYWPVNYTSETYMFGSGFAFGTICLNDTLYSTGDDLSHPGISDFVPGDGSDNPAPYDDPFFRIYKSYDIHYPVDSTLSLVDVYCVYNDLDSSYRWISYSSPVRIVVEQQLYNFRAPKVENMIFMNFKIKNKNTGNFEKSYFSFWADPDIGSDYYNELLGFVEDEDIVYQFQLEGESGWHDTPGIISFKLLQGPIATETVDVYHDGSKIILPFQPICLTQFRNVNYTTYPADIEKRYLLSAGYKFWEFDSLNPENSYEPFPLWTQSLSGYPGKNLDSTSAGNKSLIFSSGPFDLNANDSMSVSMVVYLTKSPDSIISLGNLAKWWWKNRNTKYLQFLTPLNLQKISSQTIFSWVGNITFPKYSLHFLNLSTGVWYDVKDLTTNSYLFNPATFNDAVYLCGVGGYTDTSFIGDKNHLYILVDNAGKNGPPYIYSYEKSLTDDSIITLKWKTLDPDDNLSNSYIYFVSSTNDSVYKKTFEKTDTIFSLNLVQSLPEDNYKIVLISVDDSLLSDTSIVYHEFFLSGIDYDRKIENKNIFTFKVLQKKDLIELIVEGKKDDVEISLYNIEGRKMENIYSGSVDGTFRITRKLNLPCGIYFIKEKTTRKIQHIYLIK
ncbi:MAG: hypothetical protein ABIN39_00905 [candidate division WOR-3 bacterium]